MIKYILSTTIPIFCIVLQACSKKDTAPAATGYEGVWTGKSPNYNPEDSIQFNLKLRGGFDGKIRIKADGSTSETLRGNWYIIDTLLVISTLGVNNFTRTFVAPLHKKNTLRGKWNNSFNFYLALKK